ncbi:MAG TPA: serine hydrolase domain-containing protein [Frankiaceae bacterium]|nr:serine hydrolase domain-containing protein [Frankiaceae bacterium]
MSAADACQKLVREKQADRRLPSVSAVVFRGGDQLWYGAAGSAALDPPAPPIADTQYRLGSITKTFTAVLVMQLRDEGRLDLDDRIGQHLPDAPHGAPTIRRLLCHLSGLQREPVGEVWETLVPPAREELLGNYAGAEFVLPPNRRWHYSNLAYALLGEVVARLTGGAWEEALRDRLLTPLGLARTTLEPEAPYAQGYFVHPYADRAAEEPYLRMAGTASAAQLWASASDLAKWGAFVLAPDPAVLAPETLAEMTHLHAMADQEGWALAWGLGWMLFRHDGRILTGHTGGMPGHLAGLAVSRKDGVGAAVFCNGSASFEPGPFACELVSTWLAQDPAPPAEWAPGAPVPAAYETALGRWWTEGSEFVFSWREGRLQALPVGAPKTLPPAVFEPAGKDAFRGVSGREQGEWLRLVRDDGGNVTKMYWATYPLTREPVTFGAT